MPVRLNKTSLSNVKHSQTFSWHYQNFLSNSHVCQASRAIFQQMIPLFLTLKLKATKCCHFQYHQVKDGLLCAAQTDSYHLKLVLFQRKFPELECHQELRQQHSVQFYKTTALQTFQSQNTQQIIVFHCQLYSSSSLYDGQQCTTESSSLTKV